MTIGRLVSFWECVFLGAMLNFWGVGGRNDLPLYNDIYGSERGENGVTAGLPVSFSDTWPLPIKSAWAKHTQITYVSESSKHTNTSCQAKHPTTSGWVRKCSKVMAAGDRPQPCKQWTSRAQKGPWDGEHLTVTHFSGLLGLGLIEECKGIPSCGKIPWQRDHWNEENTNQPFKKKKNIVLLGLWV